MRDHHRRHLYLLYWLTIAAVLGGLLARSEYIRNPLNDPDQAHQRTGFVLPPQAEPSPPIADTLRTGHCAIVFFARSLKDQYLFHDLADQADLAQAADLIVVTTDGSKPIIENGIRQFVGDADGSLAQAFGLRPPIDGGTPIGYALVDALGYIRYRTLDPGFMHRADELRLMLREIS